MPHWALRALTTFSLNPLRNSGVSRSGNHGNFNITPFLSNALLTLLSATDVRRPELEDGLATPPDSEDGCKTSQAWLCHCEYRQVDFCPYCEYDQTVLVNALVVETTSSTSEHDTRPLRFQLMLTHQTANLRRVSFERLDPTISSSSTKCWDPLKS